MASTIARDRDTGDTGACDERVPEVAYEAWHAVWTNGTATLTAADGTLQLASSTPLIDPASPLGHQVTWVPLPKDAARFVRLMRLKTELRRLRVLGCEATAREVKLHLREDTPLDPGKLRNLIVKGGGQWRATPDMRLVRVFEEPGGDGLSRAEQMLEELAKLGV